MLRVIAVAIIVALAIPVPARADGEWVWPVEGRVITPFEYRASRPYDRGLHRGVDIRARPGARVVAAAAGTVVFAGRLGSSGLTVSIETARGELRTSYLHLSGVSVSAGQEVATGQAIGAAGATGRPGTPGSHLHFGVREAGGPTAYRDPLAFLPGASEEEPPPVGPGGLRRPPKVRRFAVPPRSPVRPGAEADPGLVIAGMALAVLAACLGVPAPRRAASSIARRWVTTSQRRSTT